MAPGFCFPPVDFWSGVSPSQAAKSRPDLNTLGFGTLAVIAWQAYETRRSVETASSSVAQQKIAMDQWVETDEWDAHVPHTQPNAKTAKLTVEFRLKNSTRYPLTLRSLILWFDYRHAQTTAYPKMPLVPEESMPVTVEIPLEGQKLALYLAGHLSFLIGGVIAYVDVFKDEKSQKFGVICKVGLARESTFEIGSFDPPLGDK